MGIEFNAEFPCGYKISMKAKFGMFSLGDASFDEKDFKECPLHGKNCPPKGMKTKKSSPNQEEIKLLGGVR